MMSYALYDTLERLEDGENAWLMSYALNDILLEDGENL